MSHLTLHCKALYLNLKTSLALLKYHSGWRILSGLEVSERPWGQVKRYWWFSVTAFILDLSLYLFFFFFFYVHLTGRIFRVSWNIAINSTRSSNLPAVSRCLQQAYCKQHSSYTGPQAEDGLPKEFRRIYGKCWWTSLCKINNKTLCLI